VYNIPKYSYRLIRYEEKHEPIKKGFKLHTSFDILNVQNLFFILIRTIYLRGVGIATSYGLDDGGVGVRVPLWSRILSSPRRPDRLWCPPYSIGNGGSSPGG
jgi:hypothetical protein